MTEVTSQIDKQASILYLFNPDPSVEIEQPQLPYLLLEARQKDSGIEYVYVKQPAFNDLPAEYADYPEFEKILDTETNRILSNRTHKHYISNRTTSTLFFKDNLEVIGYGAQDPDKHIFEINNEVKTMLKTKYGLSDQDLDFLKEKYKEYEGSVCVRELIKLEAHNLSDNKINHRPDFYEICPGCTGDNHGEPNAIRNVEKESKLEELKDSNALVYGHWWSCSNCRKLMKNLGVKQIYLSRRWTKNYLGID